MSRGHLPRVVYHRVHNVNYDSYYQYVIPGGACPGSLLQEEAASGERTRQRLEPLAGYWSHCPVALFGSLIILSLEAEYTHRDSHGVRF